MQRKSKNSTLTAEPSSSSHEVDSDEKPKSIVHEKSQIGSSFLFLTLLVLLLHGSWAIYRFQFHSLPDSNQAGKRGFLEKLAMEHVRALTKLGPHLVGSDELGLAVKSPEPKALAVSELTEADPVSSSALAGLELLFSQDAFLDLANMSAGNGMNELLYTAQAQKETLVILEMALFAIHSGSGSFVGVGALYENRHFRPKAEASCEN